MKRGRLIFDTQTGSWRREPAQATGREFLIAAAVMLAIAAILIVVWSKMI